LAELPRRELDELFTRYEMHPFLFDLFVEGEFDRDFVVDYLENKGQAAAVSVLPIDDVELPSDILTRLGLTAGSNKSRLMALAILLDQRLGDKITNVTCLVDADTDRFLSKLRDSRRLVYTDFTCLEMYLLTHQTLRKFLSFVCKLHATKVDDFLKLAYSVLPAQFAVRVVNESLDLNIAPPLFTSGLRKKSDIHSFERKLYLDAFVQKGRLSKRRSEIEEFFEAVLDALPGEIRHTSQGHDFLQLLFDFAWKNDGIKLHSKDEDVLKFGGRLVAAGIARAQIANERLWARIDSAATGKTFMYGS
jgi:hypothetical protein